MVYTYLSSPEGKGAIEAELKNPHGQRMAFLLLAQSLDTLDLPEDVRIIIRQRSLNMKVERPEGLDPSGLPGR